MKRVSEARNAKNKCGVLENERRERKGRKKRERKARSDEERSKHVRKRAKFFPHIPPLAFLHSPHFACIHTRNWGNE